MTGSSLKIPPFVLAFPVLLALAAAPSEAPAVVDLTGDYRVDVAVALVSVPDACALSAAQSGTALDLTFTCFDGLHPLSGTIDPSTGVFSVSGLAPDGNPEVVDGVGAADSLSLSGTVTIGSLPAGSIFATRCGNGIADAGEACEDGNRSDGDCCSATCFTEPAAMPCDAPSPACTFAACDGAGSCVPGSPSPSGTACDTDGDLCTVDECDGAGGCVAIGGPVTCGTCEVCDPAAGCVADVRTLSAYEVPPPGECRRYGTTRLVAISRPDHGRDALRWTWSRGDAFAATEFGDPTASTDYLLCVFLEDGGVYETLSSAGIPSGATWRPSAGGFRHRSRDDVATRVVLRTTGGDKGNRVNVVARGAGLGFPDSFGSYDRVQVQLHADNGNCWAGGLTRSDVRRSSTVMRGSRRR
jgi:cysteine-rich repeat protein